MPKRLLPNKHFQRKKIREKSNILKAGGPYKRHMRLERVSFYLQRKLVHKQSQHLGLKVDLHMHVRILGQPYLLELQALPQIKNRSEDSTIQAWVLTSKCFQLTRSCIPPDIYTKKNSCINKQEIIKVQNSFRQHFLKTGRREIKTDL